MCLFEAKCYRGREEKQVGKRLFVPAFLLNLCFQIKNELDAKFLLQHMIVSFYFRAVEQQTGFFWLIIKILVEMKPSRKTYLLDGSDRSKK